MINSKQLVKINVNYVLIQVFFWVAYSAILGFPAIFLKARGFSDLEVGVILALENMGGALMQPFFPRILEQLKLSVRKLTAALFGIGIVMSGIIVVIPPIFGLFFVVFAVFSVTQIACGSLINTIAIEYTNQDVPVNFGLGRGLGSVGFAFSALYLGRLIDLNGVNIIFLSNAIFMALAIVAVLLLKPAKYYKNDPEDAKTADTKTRKQQKALGFFAFLKTYPFFGLFLLAGTASYIGFGNANSFLLYIVGQFGGTAADVGFILALAAFCELPMMASFVLVNRRIKTVHLLLFSTFFLFLKVLGTWYAPSLQFLQFVQLTQVFGFGLFFAASVNYANQVIDHCNAVMAQGLLFANMSIAYAVGSLIGGVILDASGVRTLLGFCVWVSAFGVVLMMYSALKMNRKAEMCED